VSCGGALQRACTVSRLAHVARDELRALDGQERQPALCGHCFGEQRLARAGWAVEQHSRALSQPCAEEVRLLQRQLDRL
jgi:hypothetical protein